MHGNGAPMLWILDNGLWLDIGKWDDGDFWQDYPEAVIIPIESPYPAVLDYEWIGRRQRGHPKKWR